MEIKPRAYVCVLCPVNESERIASVYARHIPKTNSSIVLQKYLIKSTETIFYCFINIFGILPVLVCVCVFEFFLSSRCVCVRRCSILNIDGFQLVSLPAVNVCVCMQMYEQNKWIRHLLDRQENGRCVGWLVCRWARKTLANFNLDTPHTHISGAVCFRFNPHPLPP